MAGMRILITGITGFVGSHLAEYALTRGAEVFGSVRWRSKTEHIEHLRDRVTLIESDLRANAGLEATLGLASDASDGSSAHDQLTDLWPLLAGLALLLILAEWALSLRTVQVPGISAHARERQVEP